MSQTKLEGYRSKYIDNREVEWLIEHGNKHDTIYFKGETGDRYSIYIFTKRNRNTVDITLICNSYSHGASEGSRLGYIKDYVLHLIGDRMYSWRGDAGESIKQLMRQGVCPRGNNSYKIRYCRSSYFMKTHDKKEFTPWLGIKVNLITGLLVNKPNKWAKSQYDKAKKFDKEQRKRNYIANRENARALQRYREAGGDTESARTVYRNGAWQTAKVGAGIENIDWSKIPLEDVFRHRNATLRSNIIEHYGMNAIIAKLNHTVLNEDIIDGRPYKLLEVDIPDFSDSSPDFDGSYKGLFLEMINPSTGESHFEGVPDVSDNKWARDALKEPTVKAALSWRDDDILVQKGNNRFSYSGPVSGETYIKPVILK